MTKKKKGKSLVEKWVPIASTIPHIYRETYWRVDGKRDYFCSCCYHNKDTGYHVTHDELRRIQDSDEQA